VCTWACAKQIHAKLAEVTFDRKTAENEAACLQWAVEQTMFKQTDLDAKTTECANLNARVRVLESQLKQFGSFDALNAEYNELIQRCFRLEEELAHARKLDREELASILRSAIRVPRMLRRRPRSR
jgi:response regulator RpfG family c-di-GMP phosphodiesterase